MTSRQITPSIATPDDLPDRYPGSSDAGITPKLDWLYIQAATGPGARFAGPGVLVNAEHARRRLVKAGLMHDWTQEGTTGFLDVVFSRDEVYDPADIFDDEWELV